MIILPLGKLYEEGKISSGIGAGILECSRFEFYRLISEQGYDNLFKQIYCWVFMGNEVMSAGQLLKQANQLKRMGKLDEAIALYREAIKLNPDFAWTYYELGDTLAKSGNLDDSVICLQKSTVLKPNFYLAHEKLATIFQEQGKIDLAIAEYRKAKNSQNLQSEKKPTSSLEQYIERVESYKSAVENLYQNQKWLDYPVNVSVETFASCNAACNFCPYPSLDRKGTKMSEDLFKKIIDEISEPGDYVLPSINLTRVNEPFLDKRIFEFMKYVNFKLPKTKISLFTNASILDEKKLDKLMEIKNISFLNISFNDHRPLEYEKVMKIPFKPTHENIKKIHERKKAGEIKFPITLGRVGDGTVADDDFLKWTENNFPGFQANISPRFDWIGKLEINTFPLVPDLGCRQWFMLHFLATGKEAFCCIDSEGIYGQGDANLENVIDVYNKPHKKRMRQERLSRGTDIICSKCSALS